MNKNGENINKTQKIILVVGTVLVVGLFLFEYNPGYDLDAEILYLSGPHIGMARGFLRYIAAVVVATGVAIFLTKKNN